MFLKLFLFIVRERGRDRKREGEKYQSVRERLIGCFSQVSNWGPSLQRTCVPDQELNWQLFALWGNAQPSEPCGQGYPQNLKTLIHKDIWRPYVHCSLFTVVKTQKPPECPLTNN